MNKIFAFKKLERILSSVEADVLSASDRDILSTKDATNIEKEVKDIIDSRLAIHDGEVVAPIPNDARDRRQLFELIARTHSHAPREIRMAYGTGRKLSDREISALLSKLLHLGFFTKIKKK